MLPEKPYRLRLAQCGRLSVACPLNHNKGTRPPKDDYKINRRSRLYTTSHIIAKIRVGTSRSDTGHKGSMSASKGAQGPVKNRLLSALPAQDYEHLLPHLEPVKFPLDRPSRLRVRSPGLRVLPDHRGRLLALHHGRWGNSGNGARQRRKLNEISGFKRPFSG